MDLELEKLMGSKAAMISDSNRFWKWDGHSCVFGCYPSRKHSLHKAIHCAVRISLDQSSSFVLNNTRQQWDKPDSAAAFLPPSKSVPVWDPAASLASFWKPHKHQGKSFTAPQTLDKASLVWLSRNVSLGTSAALCTLNSAVSWWVWQEQPQTLQCFSAVCLSRLAQNSLVVQQNTCMLLLVSE